jgi:hypothetical protein
MLCTTNRRTSAAGAASTRLRVPITRMVELAVRSPAARSVSWCMTTSGRADDTAARRLSASRASPLTGSAPSWRIRSALAADRASPVT